MGATQSIHEPYQVAFENEYVRIVQVYLAAGQTSKKYTRAANPTVRIDLGTGGPAAARGGAHYTDGPLPEESPQFSGAANSRGSSGTERGAKFETQ
ncbi:MAG: hypothetical protein ACREQF_13555 [Candidatus Binataceae bacterium]